VTTRRLARPGIALVLAISTLVLPAPARAQISIVNTIQAQAGNVPFTPPDDRTDVYDLLDLGIAFEDGRAGLRFESDQNSQEMFGYRKITQRFAEWRDERLRIRVGNFYTLIGRGLVHRSFELPGVILDKAGLRSSYAPTRDLDGVLAEGEMGPASVRVFSGKPNGGEFTPAVEDIGLDRYRGLLGGGQLGLALGRGTRVGAGYLRSTTGGAQQEEFATGFAELDLLRMLGVPTVTAPIYLEYATAGGRADEWWRFRTGDDTRHALYGALDLLWGPATLAAEWKDYTGFRLGTNDPPSLVREHAATLLNRNTHVLDARGEEGFQLEASWTLPRLGSLVLNLSRGDGTAGARFDERYADVRVAPGDPNPWEAAVFYERGKDTFVGITDRSIYGGSATVHLTRDVSAGVEVQRQEATRLPGDAFDDELAGVTATLAGRGSLGVVLERSSDPEQEAPEDVAAPGIQSRRFLSGIASMRLSERHEMALFYGERRGGRACTAGTCYEVLPFKGAELRITSRF
jgi:hypothetical protein